MRLSNNLIHQNGLSQLLQNQNNVLTSQNQVTTGQKYSSAGQAPSDFTQAMLLNDSIEINEQHTKNLGILDSRLNLEESVLESINTTVQAAQSLAVQAGNGALSAQDREAIASELSELQKTLYDLMNTRTEDGKFLFSGYQESTQTYQHDSVTDRYYYQGDQGQQAITIASNIAINSSDNGFSVFEQVKGRLNIENTDLGTGIATISDEGAFTQFHQANYDRVTPANNVYTVNIIAPTPPAVDDTYEIVDAGGTVLQSGVYQGQDLDFNGLKIAMNEGETTASVTLQAPQKENVLNTVGKLIDTLRAGNLTPDQYQHQLADVDTGLKNASEKILFTQATLGARMNALERVQDTNAALDLNNKQARSNLVEVDMAEAVTELTQHENALQASQATFGRLANLSLFDYI